MNVNLEWKKSNCCDAQFLIIDDGFLTDICSVCGEHADITEIWCNLPFPFAHYAVSSLGEFRSELHSIYSGKKEIRLLSQGTDRDGYKVICLSVGQRNKFTKSIHRLIGLLFVPNPLRLPIINHEDLTKSNNRANNLIWTTQKMNIQHYHFYKHFKNKK